MPELYTKNHGSVLKKEIKSRGISTSELADRLDRSVPYVYKLMNEEKFDKFTIAAICSILSIDPSKFGLEKGQLHISSSDQIFAFPLYKEEGKGYEIFLRDYFSAILNNLVLAKETIMVSDFLGDTWTTPTKLTREGVGYQEYHRLYKAYIEMFTKIIIEKCEANENFRYTRIFQLPLKQCVFKASSKEVATVNWAYRNLLLHIKTLLENEKIKSQCNFYILDSAASQDSWINVDASISISEYLHYSATRQFGYADRLVISDGRNLQRERSLAQKLVHARTIKMEQILGSKEPFTLLDIETNLLKAHNIYKEQIEHLKLLIKSNTQKLKKLTPTEVNAAKKSKLIEILNPLEERLKSEQKLKILELGMESVTKKWYYLFNNSGALNHRAFIIPKSIAIDMGLYMRSTIVNSKEKELSSAN